MCIWAHHSETSGHEQQREIWRGHIYQKVKSVLPLKNNRKLSFSKEIIKTQNQIFRVLRKKKKKNQNNNLEFCTQRKYISRVGIKLKQKPKTKKTCCQGNLSKANSKGWTACKRKAIPDGRLTVKEEMKSESMVNIWVNLNPHKQYQ